MERTWQGKGPTIEYRLARAYLQAGVVALPWWDRGSWAAYQLRTMISSLWKHETNGRHLESSKGSFPSLLRHVWLGPAAGPVTCGPLSIPTGTASLGTPAPAGRQAVQAHVRGNEALSQMHQAN